MDVERLEEWRANRLTELQSLLVSPAGREQVLRHLERLKTMVRRDAFPPDDDLSAQLFAPEGNTDSWEYALIMDLLEESVYV